jgi:hypothetical protein
MSDHFGKKLASKSSVSREYDTVDDKLSKNKIHESVRSHCFDRQIFGLFSVQFCKILQL